MMMNTFLHMIVTLLNIVQLVASSSPPTTSYTSVTALDKYGHSVQLQNAQQAAARHGRLIVAACTSDKDIVVVSVYTPKLGLVETNRSVLHKLWTSGSYMACTGIKADAKWLVDNMRQYCKQLWDRFNVDTISQERLTKATSQTLLEFMGYSRNAELNDGISVEKSRGGDEDNDEPSWSRPLGIQTLIISPSSPLVLVEPSGVAQSYFDFVAIGKDSDAVMRLLRERQQASKKRKEATTTELKELLVDVIRKTVEGQKQSTELVIEAVSENGVEVSSLPLRKASRQ